MINRKIVEIDTTQICVQTLTKEDANKFKYAVNNGYWFQMYLGICYHPFILSFIHSPNSTIDDLPIYGVVGEKIDDKVYIFTHKKFIVTFNQDRVHSHFHQPSKRISLFFPV